MSDIVRFPCGHVSTKPELESARLSECLSCQIARSKEDKRQARLDALRWVCSQAMCADWHDLGERIKAEIARLEQQK